MAELSAIGVKLEDADLIHIVVKSLPNSYDCFLSHYTSSSRYHFRSTSVSNNVGGKPQPN